MLTALLPVLLALTPASPRPAADRPAAEPSASVVASGDVYARPYARLRKLHLVRPDLIPYPLAYEVYC